jgi:uncharacterized protein YkwD
MRKHVTLSTYARAACGLVALAIAGAAAGASMGGLPRFGADESSTTTMSASDVALAFEWAIDVERAHHGLGGLSVDAMVSDQAQKWSGGMALYKTLAEDRFYSAELSASDPNWQWSGENVGVGATAASIEAALMASPPHRANMLGAYTHMGVGVFIDGTGLIWVTERFYR